MKDLPLRDDYVTNGSSVDVSCINGCDIDG